MHHKTEFQDDSDSDRIHIFPLILFLSCLLILAMLYVIYLNIVIFKMKQRKKKDCNHVFTQCNLIKLQQITIHPDDSINAIQAI